MCNYDTASTELFELCTRVLEDKSLSVPKVTNISKGFHALIRILREEMTTIRKDPETGDFPWPESDTIDIDKFYAMLDRTFTTS